jgi:2-amino-4-hydroxy-6-hydroxymethyldihydropteridine diphosphokinase
MVNCRISGYPGNRLSVIVYISLGSNIGNRPANIRKAFKYLSSIPACKLKKISSLYETSPVGPKQRNFINAAAKLETGLKPFELLKELKKIENLMGRKKDKKRWAPRIIDLDILFYGSKVIKTKNLIVPHKELYNRKFVLEPLSEIAPGFVHPVIQMNVKKLLKLIPSEPCQQVIKL